LNWSDTIVSFRRIVLLVIAVITASPEVNAERPIELSCDLSSTSGSNRQETRIDEKIYVTITAGERDEVRVEVYRVQFNTTMMLEGRMSDTEVNAIRRGDAADRILGGNSEETLIINRESGDIMLISTWETEQQESVVFKFGVCKAVSCSNLLEMCNDRFWPNAALQLNSFFIS
jgi:hypothetical protein